MEMTIIKGKKMFHAYTLLLSLPLIKSIIKVNGGDNKSWKEKTFY